MLDQMNNRYAAVLRRRPVQRRGAATVNALLDACATLLAEHGYEQLTTARIAEVAGVPIGSFYQYFPDKRSVVLAMALRGLDSFLAEVDRYFQQESPATWREAVDGVLRLYRCMLDSVPGFGAVRFSDVVEGQPLDPELDHHAAMARYFAQRFGTYFGVPVDEELNVTFRVCVEALEAVVRLATRESDLQRRESILRRARQLSIGLLAPCFDGEPVTT